MAMDNGRLARGVWWVAGAIVVLLLAVSGRYGFHRDELYFIVAGRNLDWGYVDQPPLTPLLARVAETIGGTNTVALRVLPALAIGATALLAASMARRLGGGDRAQVYAALGAGGSGVALAFGHLLSTATFDYLLWTVGSWILLRLLDGADPRWWAALGVTVGIGLENKHLIAFFAGAVLIGLLATERRRLLAGAWPWIGVGLAALLALPNVLWQIANDLPQLEMARALARRSDGPAAFVLQQIGLLSIALAIPAAVGLGRLLRAEQLRRWRPIGIAFLVLFVAFLVSGGKSYYVAPMYPVLLAAGAGWIEELERLRGRLMAGTTAVGVLAGSFIALPLLPEGSMSALDATGELAETVGWPQMIDQIGRIYATLPADRREDAVVFTVSYGEAAAVDVLGSDAGLPAAASGHNTYWLWGPPADHGPIIAIGPLGDSLAPICPDLRQVDTITNPWDVANETNGYPLLLCLEPTGQLADIWDDLRHYN